MDVPEGYIVLPFSGISYGGDGAKGDFTAYDKALRQSVPSFFKFIQSTVQPDGTTEVTRIPAAVAVCGIPNQVRQGSRPVNSRAGKVQHALLAMSVVAMSLIFCFM